jgi:putative ABC transport system ATP-binding protein
VPDIRVEQVEIGFGEGPARMQALRGIDLRISPGEFTLVTGPSGSGKTSLLTIIGALLRPDSGRVKIGREDITATSEAERAVFRQRHIGFVFQAFRLMTALTAEENLRMSLTMRRIGNNRERARSALARVGLAGKEHLTPDQLSGGEKQRVAVARALAHAPAIILADEPTASLDRENGLKVCELLADAIKDADRTLVVVSHDDRLKPFADRIVRLEDGKVIEDRPC